VFTRSTAGSFPTVNLCAFNYSSFFFGVQNAADAKNPTLLAFSPTLSGDAADAFGGRNRRFCPFRRRATSKNTQRKIFKLYFVIGQQLTKHCKKIHPISQPKLGRTAAPGSTVSQRRRVPLPSLRTSPKHPNLQKSRVKQNLQTLFRWQ
jgi:hypothetical protein